MSVDNRPVDRRPLRNSWSTKYPVGSRVSVADLEPRLATVVRHGRDVNGVYTVVRFDDGTEAAYNRTWLADAALDAYRGGTR